MAARIVKEWPLLMKHGLYTLLSVLTGFAAAVAIGVPLAFGIVLNRGIQTENYDRNPVILWAHDDSQLPVGRAVGIRIAEPASKVDIEFTPADLNPFGAMVGELVRGKYLNSCSMSWMPIKWKFSTDKNRAGGVDFLEVDLLEVSIVPIPAPIRPVR